MALGKGLGSLIPQHKKSAPAKAAVVKTPKLDSEKLWQVPIEEIVPNPHQPRKHFDKEDLEDLVASIKKHGVMQPLTVSQRPDGGFELIAGERRLRASQIAGLKTVPAVVRTATEQEKLELALIENIQRQELNAIEEGIAFNRLIKEFGLTQQEVATQVGKSRSAVANTIRLLDLPEEIQDGLINGKITAGKARALLSLESQEARLEMYRSMIGEGVSTREVERQVAKRSGKGSPRRDPNVMAQEQLIEERLGTKVRISQRGEKGTITIEYYSKEELRRLLSELT
jgi:ParB family transcriptional regulator, chromosome partitioning protein